MDQLVQMVQQAFGEHNGAFVAGSMEGNADRIRQAALPSCTI
jgi:hypothetical protein